MLIKMLAVPTTLLGLYLLVAVVTACVLAVGVVSDMRGKWPRLTPLQWTAVPFLLVYAGLKHGLAWPRYAWLDFQRQREVNTRLRVLNDRLNRRWKRRQLYAR
jgi:hypothetical protein